MLAPALIAGIAGLILGGASLGIGFLLFGILLALLARIIQAGLLAEESAVVEVEEHHHEQA
ncbi:MAG: hypothetical protein ACYC6L_09360 [Anaerolineae bacterium]